MDEDEGYDIDKLLWELNEKDARIELLEAENRRLRWCLETQD